jgi:hypothetical protein
LCRMILRREVSFCDEWFWEERFHFALLILIYLLTITVYTFISYIVGSWFVLKLSQRILV